VSEIENAVENLLLFKETGEITDFVDFNYTLNLAIYALRKQLNGGWIPVIERLPKEKGFYIFQLTGGKIHEYWYEDKRLYEDCIHDEKYLFDMDKVTAWQPLPEPFKGVE
jgi:hypothetical protein